MNTLVRVFGKDCPNTYVSKIILTDHVNIRNRKEHILTDIVNRISTFPPGVWMGRHMLAGRCWFSISASIDDSVYLCGRLGTCYLEC